MQKLQFILEPDKQFSELHFTQFKYILYSKHDGNPTISDIFFEKEVLASLDIKVHFVVF